MKVLESEIKYQLYKDDFYKFKEYINNSYSLHSTVNQVNYYIDNNEFELKNNGISFRIRNKNVAYFEFTIKIDKKNTESNIHIKDEYTTKLATSIARDIIDTNNILPIIKIIKDKYNFSNTILNFNNLSILGSLSTCRTNYKFKDDIFFTLDINTYLETIDYELEVESDIGSIVNLNNEILDIFLKLNIEPISNFDSKSKRFKNEYQLK